MDIESEMTRMEAEGFRCIERVGYFRRTRDGLRVRAADWPDGDVSWVLDPMPLISPEMVGTCSAEEFIRDFVAA